MRFLFCAVGISVLAGAGWCGDLEISTGFLIGPSYDARSFYVRASSGEAWRKTCSTPEFRKQAQGRMVGVQFNAGLPLPALLPSTGLQLIRVPLQTPQSSLFAPDGALRGADLLDAMLRTAAQRGVAVELVLFHPSQDQHFDSPEAILAAVRNLTDWLIDRGHRHVFLDPAADWSEPGWDFDHFVPQNLERIAALIRERFHAKHTDDALPVVLTTANLLAGGSKLAEEADIIVAHGEALAINPKLFERPVLASGKSAAECAAALERYAGCVVEAPAGEDVVRQLAPLVLRPSRP
jgi:hypothetical protein